MRFQGGLYNLVLSADQHRMLKPSFAGINVKPTTGANGKMTFKLTEPQWQQFQQNQAKTAAGPGMCEKVLCDISLFLLGLDKVFKYLPCSLKKM